MPRPTHAGLHGPARYPTQSKQKRECAVDALDIGRGREGLSVKNSLEMRNFCFCRPGAPRYGVRGVGAATA